MARRTKQQQEKLVWSKEAKQQRENRGKPFICFIYGKLCFMLPVIVLKRLVPKQQVSEAVARRKRRHLRFHFCHLQSRDVQDNAGVAAVVPVQVLRGGPGDETQLLISTPTFAHFQLYFLQITPEDIYIKKAHDWVFGDKITLFPIKTIMFWETSTSPGAVYSTGTKLERRFWARTSLACRSDPYDLMQLFCFLRHHVILKKVKTNIYKSIHYSERKRQVLM